jgi:hypothetical protein
MRKHTSLSLTGKNTYNTPSLSGLNNTSNESNDIKMLKINILNKLLIPLISNQWDILYENICLLENIKNKINDTEDMLIYKEIIKAIETIFFEHKQLETLEQKVYGSADMSTMIYKTSLIRLKPEYEIYNVIIGKPDKYKKEKYNQLIIDDIKLLLTNENIDFDKIRNFIIKKYSNER